MRCSQNEKVTTHGRTRSVGFHPSFGMAGIRFSKVVPQMATTSLSASVLHNKIQQDPCRAKSNKGLTTPLTAPARSPRQIATIPRAKLPQQDDTRSLSGEAHITARKCKSFSDGHGQNPRHDSPQDPCRPWPLVRATDCFLFPVCVALETLGKAMTVGQTPHLLGLGSLRPPPPPHGPLYIRDLVLGYG